MYGKYANDLIMSGPGKELYHVDIAPKQLKIFYLELEDGKGKMRGNNIF